MSRCGAAPPENNTDGAVLRLQNAVISCPLGRLGGHIQKESIPTLGCLILLVMGACSGTTEPSVVVFNEDFGGAYPGNWSQFPPPSSRGTSVIDPDVGNPKPSLALYNVCRQIPLTDPALNICEPTASIVGNTTDFELGGTESVSVSVDILLAPLAGGGTASAGFSIGAIPPNGDASLSVSLEKGVEIYSFCTSPTANCTVVQVPFSPDGRFHTYRFVAESNRSLWQRDGVTRLSASAALHGQFQIHLSAIAIDVTGAKREYPVAHFDNVRVTQP